MLTVVGADRAGLVAAIADVVSDHGGNWETSQLAELAGTFAGVIEISVAPERADDLIAALRGLDGLLTVAAHPGAAEAASAPLRELNLTILGNDRPGIVREISTALGQHGVSIDRLTTAVRDAAMYGGRLFEASVVAHVPDGVDPDAVQDTLERIAAEIQVDLTVG